jgi:hypothetical protein
MRNDFSHFAIRGPKIPHELSCNLHKLRTLIPIRGLVSAAVEVAYHCVATGFHTAVLRKLAGLVMARRRAREQIEPVLQFRPVGKLRPHPR